MAEMCGQSYVLLMWWSLITGNVNDNWGKNKKLY